MWSQVQNTMQQSMLRVLEELGRFVPGLVGFILVVLLFSALGWLLAWVLRRIFQAAHFDESLARWGFIRATEWPQAASPSRLIVRVVFWIIVALGVLTGSAAFDANLTSQLVYQLVSALPNLVIAGFIILIGRIVARFLSRSVLIGAVNMNLEYAGLLATGVKWLIVVFAAAMALDQLAIAGNIVHLGFGILFGGIVLALALAVGLGSKELVSRSLQRETDRNREPSRRPMEAEDPIRHV
jgi:hypothetical protein